MASATILQQPLTAIWLDPPSLYGELANARVAQHLAATFPNTTARLHAWIVNARSLKPGVRMPSLDQFDGETLRVMGSYLQGLE